MSAVVSVVRHSMLAVWIVNYLEMIVRQSGENAIMLFVSGSAFFFFSS
jgi:hypothetical protein